MKNKQDRLSFIDDQVLSDLLKITDEHEETRSPLEIKIKEEFPGASLRHGVYEIVLNYQRCARLLKKLYADPNETHWARVMGIPDNEVIAKKLRPVVDMAIHHYKEELNHAKTER